MSLSFSRRALLGGLGAAALPWDLARAEAAGGTLRVGMTASAIPLANGVPDQGAEGHRFMGITLFDQLVHWDLSSAEKPAVLKPGLATDWKPDPAEPKRWIFTLREGVRFHDGKPFTAEDVVFSFDRLLKNDHPAFDARGSAISRSRFVTVASYRAAGPHTLVIDCNRVDSMLPYLLVWVGITHQGAWEAAGRNWDTFMTRAVGSGPWKMESFSIRERCVMLRNPDYWDADRIPRAERLVLLPLAEPNTRVAALRAGQVDFIEAPPPDAIPTLQQAGYRITSNVYPHNWMYFLSYVEGSPWRDPRIRRAANLGIDRTGMKAMLGGMMSEGAGLLYEGHPWYGEPKHRPRFDPDAARKLLAEAGFTPRSPLRTKVAISPSGSGQMQPLPMNEYVQQNLKEVGIDIAFEVMDWNTLLTQLREGAWMPGARGCHAINASWNAQDPYVGFIRPLHSAFAPPVAFNWGKHSDPQADALMDAMLLEFDTDKQDALMRRLHARLVEQDACIFIAHDLNPRAMGPKVKGFVQAQSWLQDLTPVRIG
ncbi:ABC transporter substrate-binding protein [Paracraurococcus lichenis]|uniref:ABC transporter substrate-binding protein n=1 Tax=Paracraurococcus lichenis TaxID=3064888 RepID=A0ABT9DU35_9PROT|nr:ABC transporter substrate-binding protein [Paracraurococcus sp. LOR1-02]MDO9707310.1 ABC transporter substrate-binding protein [Paracraurococcus sp. LOR1-02]